MKFPSLSNLPKSSPPSQKLNREKVTQVRGKSFNRLRRFHKFLRFGGDQMKWEWNIIWGWRLGFWCASSWYVWRLWWNWDNTSFWLCKLWQKLLFPWSALSQKLLPVFNSGLWLCPSDFARRTLSLCRMFLTFQYNFIGWAFLGSFFVFLQSFRSKRTSLFQLLKILALLYFYKLFSENCKWFSKKGSSVRV